MLSVHERAQLVAAARLYYESNLTQAQIAQRLNVSRPSVSKMLARARELGIVHIEIRAGDEGKADLLQRLQSKYALAGGCVLTDEQDALTQAMHYLMAETTADKSLALGWGYALGEVVLKAADCSSYTQDGMVYPLIGTANFPNKGYHPDELVKIWASACAEAVICLAAVLFLIPRRNAPSWKAVLSISSFYSNGKVWMLLLFQFAIILPCPMKQRQPVSVMRWNSKRP